jgi:hypothetical protein
MKNRLRGAVTWNYLHIWPRKHITPKRHPVSWLLNPWPNLTSSKTNTLTL